MEDPSLAQGGVVQSATQPPPASTSHFLRLPLEIRDLIYENLLVARSSNHRENSAHPTPISGHSNMRDLDISIAILLANRQTSVEAARVLYGQNVFCFGVQGGKEVACVERCGNEPCGFRRWPCWVHPRNLSLIRNVQIDIYSYYNQGQDFNGFHNLARLCRVFTFLPPLKTVVVRYQMLLGAEGVIETPNDAHVIARRLRESNNYEQSDHARRAFMSRREGAWDKILLALTLLRAIRSVTIQPLPNVSLFDVPLEVYFLRLMDRSPLLSDGYTQFLQDKILLPSTVKASDEDESGAYDSGVDL